MADRGAFERALWRAREEAFGQGLRRSWLIWAVAALALIAYVVLERLAPLH
jgi:hypothetical protein